MSSTADVSSSTHYLVFQRRNPRDRANIRHTLSTWKHYARKRASLKNRLTFLKRCLAEGLTPATRRQRRTNVPAFDALRKRLEANELRAAIADLRYQLRKANCGAARCRDSLRTELQPHEFDAFRLEVRRVEELEFLAVRTREQRKFANLQLEFSTIFTTQRLHCGFEPSWRQYLSPPGPSIRPVLAQVSPPSSNVINLSSKPLTAAQLSALNHGFQFATSVGEKFRLRTLAAVENIASTLPAEFRNTFRLSFENVLFKSCEGQQSNLTRAEIDGLTELRKDDTRVTLRDDKSSRVVVLNTADYVSKFEECELSKTDVYRHLRANASVEPQRVALRQLLVDLEREGALSADEVVAHQLLPSSPVLPLMYGLPKTHKPADDRGRHPLRPVLPMIGALTHKLSRFLFNLLKPLAFRTSSYLKDSLDFKRRVAQFTPHDGDLLVSFDVTSLFTNVNVDEAIAILLRRVNGATKPLHSTLKASHIEQLLRICTHSTRFEFAGKRYEQISGTPMGSSISSLLAQVVMEEFEENALALSPAKPECWVRYVDDIFFIWRHGGESLDRLLNLFNSLSPKLKFTMEMSIDGRLPFLDVLVMSNFVDSRFDFDIHRKPTAVHRYLDFSSAHPRSTFIGIVSGAHKKAKEICSKAFLPIEENRLRSAFAHSGYPVEIVEQVLRARHRHHRAPRSRLRWRSMPFVGEASDMLKRIAQKSFGVSLAFRPIAKLQQLVTKPHRRTEVDSRRVKDAIYKISCKTCNKCYIGETGRPLLKRIAEHRSAVAKVEGGLHGAAVVHAFASSDCAVHVANGKYDDSGKIVKPFTPLHELNFDFANIEVLERVAKPHERKLHEAVHIIIEQGNFNRSCGREVSPIYARLVNEIAGGHVL